jgi:signal transduction histidine kinase
LYGLAVLVSDEPPPDREPQARPLDLQQAVAVGLIVLGVLLLLRATGLWFGDALVWPAVLVGVGSAVIWTRGHTSVVREVGDPLGLRGPWSLTVGRIVAGATMTGAGVLLFLRAAEDPLAVIAPLAGVSIGGVLLLAPWLYRLWEQLGREREQRARVEARDEVAAHLHDSVLQTLALIQRSQQQPRRMVALARRQERELRTWLYGGRDMPGTVASLATAIDEVVSEVEAGFDVDVDVVVVGDHDGDEAIDALLAATREALVNVGKHAAVDQASLYAEVDEDRVSVFVRDRGVGFDPALVATDRHGLRNSIRGRLERVGGGCAVVSDLGQGTEIELWVPAHTTPAERKPR